MSAARAQDQIISSLKAELMRQWEYNHNEHCGKRPCIHAGECQWPLPAVIPPNEACLLLLEASEEVGCKAIDRYLEERGL
jgi:hypothetical protein